MITSLWRTVTFMLRHPLGKKDRINCLSRWLRWQIGSKLLPYPMVVPFVENSCILLEKGMTGASGNFYVGLHEFHDMMFVMHALRPEDQFLDIGANVGTYTILASSVIGAKAITFEPAPSTFASLKRNIDINQIQNLVDARQVGVGGEESTIMFSIDRGPMNQVVDSSYKGKVEAVHVLKLDSVELDPQAAAIIWKIDVEGYEEKVLAGASYSLNDPRLKAVFLEAKSELLTRTMLDAGFCEATYDASTRTLKRVSHSPGVVFNNHLWIRDFEFVEERIRTARKIKIVSQMY